MTERPTRRLPPHPPSDDDVTLPFERRERERRRQDETVPMPIETE